MISVMPAAKYQSDFSFSAASRLQAGGWFDKISWFRGALGTEAADNSILSPLTSPDRASTIPRLYVQSGSLSGCSCVMYGLLQERLCLLSSLKGKGATTN